MGHRKQSAPRHGSLAFIPRARAGRMVARIRYWPSLLTEEPKILGFAAYKVGMTHVMAMDNRDFSPTRGREIQIPTTVLEAPPLKVIAVRAYATGPNGPVSFCEVWVEKVPPQVIRKIKTIKNAKFAAKAEELLSAKEKVADVRLIVCTQPWISGLGKKTPEIFEVALAGDVGKKVEHAIALLDKEISASDVLKVGQYVDVFAITKGKGFASTIKRFHVRIMSRKSNKTRRGIATMGAKSPNNVMYNVPRAGQLGFWQRYVRNLLVLKIGADPKEVSAKGGFLRYGDPKSDYVLLSGSVPGPSKRLVRIRVSARKHSVNEKALQVTYVSQESKQGV